MNLFLGIVWFLVTLTVATEPLINRHQPDVNNGDGAVHHEIRQLEAGGFVPSNSSLVSQNNVVVATASVTGKMFSNATSSGSPSFISVTPTGFLDPAPIPKKTASTLVTVETVSLPQETSTETDVVLTTSSATPSTTGSIKDVAGNTLDDQKTSKETALSESSSAPAMIATTVTLIPIEASSSQTSDSLSGSTSSSQIMQTPGSSIVVPTAHASNTDLAFASASSAPFTSTRVVGTPISNPPSPNTSPSDDANSLSTIPLTTISTTTTFTTTTRYTTTTITDATVSSTVTLLDTSSTQSSISSITSQSLIGKLPSGGSLPSETFIETITSGGSTYTTTETAPGSTMTLSIVINPAFGNSASYLPHLSSDTAAGITVSSSALPSCTCPTPQTVTVTQTVSPPSTTSFTPQIPPSDGFVGVPATTSLPATTSIPAAETKSSKSSGIPESFQSPTPSYTSPPSIPPAASSSSFSLATISIYPSSSSVVASLSKATPYPNSTIPANTSGSFLGTAIQPPSSASSTHSSGQLPSGTHLSVTPVPQSTSPLTSSGAADFRRVFNGAEGVALVVGLVALALLF